MASVTVDVSLCKGCELCIMVCPRRLLKKSATISERGMYVVDVTEANSCSGCMQCVLVCPDVAIAITDERGSSAPTPPNSAAA